MDQRSMCLYLDLKGMSTQVIFDDLVATLGDETLAYSTVTKYLRKAKSDTARVPSNPDASSHHLTMTTPTGRS
jgi:hypothetical protein